MVKRPDEDFIKLKEALITLGQLHIVRYLESVATDSADRADELPPANATRTDFSTDYVPGWKNLLVSNRTKLIDKLTVDDDLITRLINLGVINVTFSEMLKVMMSV